MDTANVSSARKAIRILLNPGESSGYHADHYGPYTQNIHARQHMFALLHPSGSYHSRTHEPPHCVCRNHYYHSYGYWVPEAMQPPVVPSWGHHAGYHHPQYSFPPPEHPATYPTHPESAMYGHEPTRIDHPVSGVTSVHPSAYSRTTATHAQAPGQHDAAHGATNNDLYRHTAEHTPQCDDIQESSAHGHAPATPSATSPTAADDGRVDHSAVADGLSTLGQHEDYSEPLDDDNETSEGNRGSNKAHEHSRLVYSREELMSLRHLASPPAVYADVRGVWLHDTAALLHQQRLHGSRDPATGQGRPGKKKRQRQRKQKLLQEQALEQQPQPQQQQQHSAPLEQALEEQQQQQQQHSPRLEQAPEHSQQQHSPRQRAHSADRKDAPATVLDDDQTNDSGYMESFVEKGLLDAILSAPGPPQAADVISPDTVQFCFRAHRAMMEQLLSTDGLKVPGQSRDTLWLCCGRSQNENKEVTIEHVEQLCVLPTDAKQLDTAVDEAVSAAESKVPGSLQAVGVLFCTWYGGPRLEPRLAQHLRRGCEGHSLSMACTVDCSKSSPGSPCMEVYAMDHGSHCPGCSVPTAAPTLCQPRPAVFRLE